jgi:AcrR family transcriptional regulator
MPRPSKRAALLDAAISVIRRDGAHRLTLDAVAAEAGVSKGGVLYHFATKRALIEGLIERWLDDFEARLTGSDFAAAYVRASDMRAAPPELSASEFGLIAALVEEPQVLQVARERHAAWMERMKGGDLDATDAWIVRLAADGLWYADLLGIAPPDGAERERVLARLLALSGAAPR